jgi:hypothetical protein
METKFCRKCHLIKPPEDFYERSLNKDGLSSYCRPCTRAMTLGWRAKNPGKRKAHQAVAIALKNRIMVKPDACEMCKRSTLLVAHHTDYEKPLEVIWVCDACHYKIHHENGQRNGFRQGLNYKNY